MPLGPRLNNTLFKSKFLTVNFRISANFVLPSDGMSTCSSPHIPPLHSLTRNPTLQSCSHYVSLAASSVSRNLHREFKFGTLSHLNSLVNQMPRKKAPLKFAALLTLPPHLQQIRDRYDMARQAAQARRKRYRKLRQVKTLMSPDSPGNPATITPQQPPAEEPDHRPAAEAASSDQAAGGATTTSTTESEETQETYSGTDVDFSTDIFDDDSFFFAHNID